MSSPPIMFVRAHESAPGITAGATDYLTKRF
jgi:hypothetical protein